MVKRCWKPCRTLLFPEGVVNLPQLCELLGVKSVLAAYIELFLGFEKSLERDTRAIGEYSTREYSLWDVRVGPGGILLTSREEVVKH